MSGVDVIYTPQRLSNNTNATIPVTYVSTAAASPSSSRVPTSRLPPVNDGADALESPRYRSSNKTHNTNTNANQINGRTATAYDPHRQLSTSPMRKTYMSGMPERTLSPSAATPSRMAAASQRPQQQQQGQRRVAPTPTSAAAAATSARNTVATNSSSPSSSSKYAQSKSIFDRIYENIVKEGGAAGSGVATTQGKRRPYDNADYDDDEDDYDDFDDDYDDDYDAVGDYVEHAAQTRQRLTNGSGNGGGEATKRRGASGQQKASAAPAAPQAGPAKTPFRVTSLQTHHKLFAQKHNANTNNANNEQQQPQRQQPSPPRNPSPNAPRYADPTTASTLKSRASGGSGKLLESNDAYADGDNDSAEIEAVIQLERRERGRKDGGGERRRGVSNGRGSATPPPVAAASSLPTSRGASPPSQQSIYSQQQQQQQKRQRAAPLPPSASSSSARRANASSRVQARRGAEDDDEEMVGGRQRQGRRNREVSYPSTTTTSATEDDYDDYDDAEDYEDEYDEEVDAALYQQQMRDAQQQQQQRRIHLAQPQAIDQYVIENYLPQIRNSNIPMTTTTAATTRNATETPPPETPQASSVNTSSVGAMPSPQQQQELHRYASQHHHQSAPSSSSALLYPNSGSNAAMENTTQKGPSSGSFMAAANTSSSSQQQQQQQALSSSMLTSPLRHLSRQQLADQLANYASAYVEARDTNEVAAQRIEELSRIADTSTSLAEESDRNCKALLEKLEAAGQKVTETNARLVSALEENGQLKAFLAEAKRRFDESEARIASLRQTNNGLEDLLGPLQKDYEKLRLENETHQQEVLTLKAKHELALQTMTIKHAAEVDHLTQSVTRFEREVKDIREGMADAERTHQRDRKELSARLEDSYAEADKYKGLLETLRAELRSVSDAAERERTNHVRQEQVYVNELESLKARISSLSSTYEQCSNRKNELEREMVAMRDAHNAMTAKVKTTLAELETTDAEKESRKMLERQNLEMERQINDLRATLQTFMTTRRVPQ